MTFARADEEGAGSGCGGERDMKDSYTTVLGETTGTVHLIMRRIGKSRDWEDNPLGCDCK